MAQKVRLDGFNVTVPHKEKIIPLLDIVSKAAKTIGAVNTVVRKRARWYGDNSDWQGYLFSYKARFKKKPLKGKRIVLLGAGGAARAIVYALCHEKVSEIIIANRNAGRAEKLVRHFNRHFPHIPKRALPLNSKKLGEFLAKTDLLINATTVGLGNSRFSKSPIRSLRHKAIVSDIVYNPPLSPLLKEAKKSGHPILPGVGMFLHQAALSFELWTGKKPRGPRGMTLS